MADCYTCHGHASEDRALSALYHEESKHIYREVAQSLILSGCSMNRCQYHENVNVEFQFYIRGASCRLAEWCTIGSDSAPSRISQGSWITRDTESAGVEMILRWQAKLIMSIFFHLVNIMPDSVDTHNIL